MTIWFWYAICYDSQVMINFYFNILAMLIKILKDIKYVFYLNSNLVTRLYTIIFDWRFELKNLESCYH